MNVGFQERGKDIFREVHDEEGKFTFCRNDVSVTLTGLILFASLAFMGANARAGWLDKAVDDAVKRIGVRGVDESADGAYEGTKGALENSVKRGESPDQPPADAASNSEMGDEKAAECSRKSGESSDTAPASSASATDSDSQAGAASATTADDPDGDIKAAEVAYSRYDFIPGDNRFQGASEYELHLGESEVYIDAHEVKIENAGIEIKKHDGKVNQVAASVNGTSVKVYLNNERVANDPDGIKRPITDIGMVLGSNGGFHRRVMFTNFRVAEGGKGIRSALDTEGKIVTHGILFDTGSDRLKPESLPTLKKIQSILEADPDLKFSIEGHTDNQ